MPRCRVLAAEQQPSPLAEALKRHKGTGDLRPDDSTRFNTANELWELQRSQGPTSLVA
jgi:hypothetical protein